jgi:hypothetical protein
LDSSNYPPVFATRTSPVHGLAPTALNQAVNLS